MHHVIYVTDENENDPSITLNPDNLILLCQTCHNKIHMGNAYVRDNVEFDSNGRLIKIVNKITGTADDSDSGNYI